MGIRDKLTNEESAAKRAVTIQRLVFAVVGLALFLFILFYYLLPMWRGPVQP